MTGGIIGDISQSAKLSSEDDDGIANPSMSSASSASGSLNAFNSMVRDFKKALNERTFPTLLKKMNFFVFLILILMIILGIAGFSE